MAIVKKTPTPEEKENKRLLKIIEMLRQQISILHLESNRHRERMRVLEGKTETMSSQLNTVLRQIQRK